jgi:hypothetical protein
LSFKSGFRTASILLLVIGQLTLAEVADALVPKQGDGLLESLTFVSESLQISAQSEALDDVRVTSAADIANTWDSFRVSHGDWSAIVDKRTGKIESAEGQGIPFVPGHGNQFQMKDISADLGDDRQIDLARMEAITRAFLPRVTNLLGVDPSTLILNQGRSGQPADHLWFVDFDVTYDGVAVEGARVVFRVNSGNLIQFGSENLPSEGTQAPKAKVTRNQALKTLASYIDGFSAADTFVDGGSEHLIPVALADSGISGFQQGRGRGLARVWQFVFRRAGDVGTWRARIDAASGRMLEFRDTNDYATAQVTGCVKTSLAVTKNLPMPSADVSSGGYTNSAGIYTYSGGTVTSSLNGQYAKVIDACGPISIASDASGNLAFGSSTGSGDCNTPGPGGTGNTRSSRTQFYYLNRAKEIARGWLNLAWLNDQVTANVNLVPPTNDDICNAFWDRVSGTLNFRRSTTGSCSNSGEIQAVGLHEFGHGLDASDGNGPSLDNGTGETYGDWTAALTTHSSCIGDGFLSSNCEGFGDACTSCTGVRDIDYAKHASATPHTVANFTQARCPAGGGYNGPCYQEGHCESQVCSEALWDLAVRDLPNPGGESAWTIMDRLWYLSRPTATAAFTCYRATSPWTSDGCGTGSLWKTMRAVDDDDGDLSNGTPNSAALYAAFNRHGIACPTDVITSFRGCAQVAAPNLSLAAANNQVTLSWSGSTGVYDIYRNEQGCNAGGFVKIANDRTTSPFTDSDVANDFVYYYKVVAQPSGNEACASAPSSCTEAIPCLPPAAPASLTATLVGANQIDLSWTDSSGATRYHIYRATTSGGPYTQIGTRSGNTFSDIGLISCTTYYYVVRAAKHETCESGNSVQVAAITAGGYSLLNVVKSGNGIGTITSSPSGINCGADCQETYLCNASVTLTAVPAAGYAFRGWSYDCGGDGTCTVTMTQSRTAMAHFTPPYLSTNISQQDGGAGIITITPAGVDARGNPTEFGGFYPYGTQVTLTATPAAGSAFVYWIGACTGTTIPCTIDMIGDRTTAAVFSKAYALAVSPAGTGSGAVTSSPAGINCGVDCNEVYKHNTSVALTATPSTGSVFNGWSGACSGTGTCTVAMTQAQAVTATFSIATYTLTVSRAGAGSGTVTSSPAGIDCGVDCNEVYNYNTSVTLTATPSVGSVFSGWSGACSGTGTCTVAMAQTQAVTATFAIATYTLTVSRTGAGSGTVTSSPAGVNCGTDCNEVYNYNTSVTLTATPSTGSIFSGWSGACSGTGTCIVAMTQAQTVTATFAIATYTLTVSHAGTGDGRVTSSPVGINCGLACNGVYNYNTSLSLTATPFSGSVFSGWSGACSGTGTCSVAMTEAQAVTATFSLAFDLTVSRAGTGSGTVTSSPAGINCGADCNEVYNYPTPVTLTATPSGDSVFIGWAGACSGTGTCTVAMTKGQNVWANFSSSTSTYTLTVYPVGTGRGTVMSTPTGINCGNACSEAYSYNTSVTLIATPSSALSRFDGWSGACTGTKNCVVTMNQARSVTATFSDNGRDFYTIAPCRIFDSRVTGTPLTSQVPLNINVVGTCGVPTTAKALSLNVTAISAPGDGSITLYPGDSDIAFSGTLTVSFQASLNRANNALIPLAWNGNGTLAALVVISGGGSMDMTLDVNGYYE